MTQGAGKRNKLLGSSLKTNDSTYQRGIYHGEPHATAAHFRPAARRASGCPVPPRRERPRAVSGGADSPAGPAGSVPAAFLTISGRDPHPLGYGVRYGGPDVDADVPRRTVWETAGSADGDRDADRYARSPPARSAARTAPTPSTRFPTARRPCHPPNVNGANVPMAYPIRPFCPDGHNLGKTRPDGVVGHRAEPRRHDRGAA